MIATLRALRLLLHIAVGSLLCAIVLLDITRKLPREKLTQWWNSALLDILNIRISIHGEPMAGARVTVANHVSWLDIPLIAASEPTRFVSKSEVRRWPIAGLFAEAAGTFYLRRGKGGSAPLLERLKPHLQTGGSVVFFPEGTTTDGAQVLNFHARLFSAAVDAACPVQPLALRYGRGADGSDVAPFIGDDDLLSHLLRILREPQLCAELTYCAALPAGLARDELAVRSRAAICTALAAASPSPALPDLNLASA